MDEFALVTLLESRVDFLQQAEISHAGISPSDGHGNRRGPSPNEPLFSITSPKQSLS